jgi:hypothetical protein
MLWREAILAVSARRGRGRGVKILATDTNGDMRPPAGTP